MVSSKQRKTMKKIFEDPISMNITFHDAIALLKSFGAETSEGRGSRVKIFINGTAHILHKPHGKKSDGCISRSDVKAFRKLITGSVPEKTIAEYLGKRK